MTDHWHIGHNLAGYLPESDVTCVRGTWQEAAEVYADEVRDYADRDDEGVMTEDPSADTVGTVGGMLAAVDSMIADGDLTPTSMVGHDLGVILEDSNGRPISLWMAASTEDDCEDAS